MSIYLGNTEIGQIYIGNTGISQAYLGGDLVFSRGTPPPQPTYITDGLIFHLDGIDRGTSDSNKWVDLVGNKEFTLYNCTIGDNYVQFNGTNSYGIYNEAWANPDVTIEIVAIAQSSSLGFAYAEREAMFGALTSTYFYFRYSEGGYKGGVAASGICNSANSSAAVINGVDRSSSLVASNYGGNSTSGYVCIGKRDAFTPNYFKGKIFAIREYNRKLSASEMIENQRVDNVRFNLGLNI